ncbi:MAG: helix-turn-helix domain-containing protein [Cruoricaptor ignavus]|nr:helix-turn-helix domain-containing protein [Cruoricaptor ignavus]
MKKLFSINTFNSENLSENNSDEFYHILLLDGNGVFSLDFGEYQISGKTAIFMSPYQKLNFSLEQEISITKLDFHGDYYCIEYHKKEVACNGLLFNNIYLYPHFPLNEETFVEISENFQKMKMVDVTEVFSDAVLKSYLQLILAICSREKSKILSKNEISTDEFSELKVFQNLVNQHFLKEKSPAFYAGLLNISPNTLSKKIKTEFGKTPSQIIQERVILEAKKQIHLTRKSIKEIATEMNFEDEFYFSKYFKKYTGVSPTKFREKVGISVVADL